MSTGDAVYRKISRIKSLFSAHKGVVEQRAMQQYEDNLNNERNIHRTVSRDRNHIAMLEWNVPIVIETSESTTLYDLKSVLGEGDLNEDWYVPNEVFTESFIVEVEPILNCITLANNTEIPSSLDIVNFDVPASGLTYR